MNDQQRRQAWVRSLIERYHKGNKAAFGRTIDAESSYVIRMLAKEGSKGAKRIGEDMVKKIAEAYPNDPPPAMSGSPEVAPDRHAQLRDAAVDMVLKSFVHALTSTTPAAAPIFAEHLRAQAKAVKPRPFADDKGVLGAVLDIADEVQRAVEASARPSRRPNSAPRTS